MSLKNFCEVVFSFADKKLMQNDENSQLLLVSLESNKNFFEYAIPLPSGEIFIQLRKSQGSQYSTPLLYIYFLNEVYNSIVPFSMRPGEMSNMIMDSETFANNRIQNAVEKIEHDLNMLFKIDFAAIVKISLINYEQEQDCSILFFGLSLNDEAISRICSVATNSASIIYFTIENARLIRKLAAGEGKGNLGLVFNVIPDSNFPVFCGYANVNVARENFRDLPVEVDIDGSMKYSLSIGGKKIFNSFNNEYYILKRSEDKLIETIRKIIHLSPKCMCDLKELLLKLKKQKHGTGVIFTPPLNSSQSNDNIKSLEVRIHKLVNCNRAMIVNFNQDKMQSIIEDETLTSLSRMDGAMLVSVGNNLVITHINAILDGECCDREYCDTEYCNKECCKGGKLERGARYNVISSFVHSVNLREKIVVGAVLSSDSDEYDVIT